MSEEDKPEDVEKKVEPEMSPVTVPSKQPMTSNELFDKICDLFTRIVDVKEAEEDEYVNIEKAVLNLQAFFYLLMRDHITIGVMNQLIREVLDGRRQFFTDDLLAVKADSLVKMIFRGQYNVPEVDASYEMP